MINKMLTFEVTVFGYESNMKVLIDCGASANYARRKTVSLNADLYATACDKCRSNEDISVKMADGSVTVVPKIQINLKFKFLDFDCEDTFFVLDLDQRYDLILGMTWLERNQPWIDWVNKTMGRTEPAPEPHHYSALESHVPSTTVSKVNCKVSGPTCEHQHRCGCDVNIRAVRTHATTGNEMPTGHTGQNEKKSSSAIIVTELEDNEVAFNTSCQRDLGHTGQNEKESSSAIKKTELGSNEVANNTFCQRESGHTGRNERNSSSAITVTELRSNEVATNTSCMSEDVSEQVTTLEVPNSLPEAKRASAEELVLALCDYSELPTEATDILALPEMEYHDFVHAIKAQDVFGIAIPYPIPSDTVDLMSSSTMDHEVEGKDGGHESQDWEALKENSFYDLLREYRDVFPEKVPDRLPKDKGSRHEIVLEPGSKYCVTRQWPLPKEQVKVIDDFFAARKAAGHVRESSSPHCSPTFCVKKPNGGWRIVHAYNKLNAATVPAQTPIPRKDVIIDSMTGSSIFSTMDLRDGFYQILMRVSDVPLTAVSTPSGMLWEWLVMPQGLKNAPATFNRVVTHLLRPCRAFAPSYFDDVYIHSKACDGLSDVEVHRLHLRRVLQILRDNGLYANLQKCMFGVEEIPVLGDFVGVNGCRVDPEKVSAIVNWPAPTCVKDLRKWLGLANYLHKYTRNYADMVRPLSSLLKKLSEWTWSEEHQRAFDLIKHSITTAPILALPDFDKPFSVVCDASDFAIGCSLMQVDDRGINRPVSYQSRQLKAAELNYPVHDRELLAMKYALVKFRVYLLGSTPFIIYTDHASLRTAVNTPHLSQRMARWLSFFAEYNFRVEYKPGRENILADALSRRPDFENSSEVLASVTSVQSTLHDRIRSAYEQDEQCHHLLKYFKQNISLPSRLEHKLHRFSCSEGLLFYHADEHDEPRIMIPNDESIRRDILYECHDAPTSGHLGREKTYLSVTRMFYWPKLYKYVSKYVRTCEICQRVKPAPSTAAPLKSLPIAHDYWASVSLDFVFGLPADAKNRTGILVFVDRTSKMVHLCAVKANVTAEQTARLFFDRIFAYHGLPDTIVSDRDPRFTSKFWRALFSLIGSKLHMSTADHPESDGQTERSNRVVEDILRSYATSNPRSWSSMLPLVEFAMNNAVHASTGFSPFYLNHMRHPRVPYMVGVSNFSEGGTPNSISASSDRQPNSKAVTEFVDKRMSVLAQVRDALANAQDMQKRQADKYGRKNTHVFEVNDKVLLSTKNLPSHAVTNLGSSKLLPRYIGPFKVMAKVSSHSYRLDIPKSMRLHPTFYVGLLKPYRSDDSVQHADQGDVDYDAHGQDHHEAERCHSASSKGSTTLVSVERSRETAPDVGEICSHPGVQVSQTLTEQRVPQVFEPGSGIEPRLFPLQHRSPPPPLIDSNGEKRYIVERILDHRLHDGRVECLVKWLGYSHDESSWEPRDVLQEDVPEIVLAYEKQNIERK